MAATILAASIIPDPFVDVIGIVAGRMAYPIGLFLAYSTVGKVIQSILFVHIALWNLSLLSSWLNLGCRFRGPATAAGLMHGPAPLWGVAMSTHVGAQGPCALGTACRAPTILQRHLVWCSTTFPAHPLWGGYDWWGGHPS